MSNEHRNVLLSVMDSSRPPLTGTVQLVPVSFGRRVGRGLARLGLFSFAGALIVILPLLHLCGLVLLLVAGPVAGYVAFRTTVLLAEGQVGCPKCGAVVPIAADTPGWPARMHCGGCGSTFFIRPAP